MKGIEIFIPVLAHMLLVIGLYFLLAIRKTKAPYSVLVEPDNAPPINSIDRL